MRSLNKSKKGVELSFNVLIALLLSLFVFGTSIYIISKFFTTTTDLQKQLDDHTLERINALLTQGSIVALPDSFQTIQRGELALFGLGILNVGSTEKKFYLNVKCAKGVSETDTVLSCRDGPPTNKDYFLIKVLPEWQINTNERQVDKILIQATKNVPTGTYSFDVRICRRSSTANSAATCDSLPDINELYQKRIYKLNVKVP